MPQPTCVLMQIVRRSRPAEQHALDLPAVGKAQEQLFRAVVRLRVSGDARGPELKPLGQLRPQRLGQIGHRVPVRRALLEQPLANLGGAVGRQLALSPPRAEGVIDGVKHVRSGGRGHGEAKS